MAPQAIAQPAAVLRTHDRSTKRSPPQRDRRPYCRAHWNKFLLWHIEVLSGLLDHCSGCSETESV